MNRDLLQRSNTKSSSSIEDLEQKLAAVLEKWIIDGQLKKPFVTEQSEHQKTNPSYVNEQCKDLEGKIDD